MSKIFNPQEKILCHLDTVEKHFKGKNPDPITLEIDPSNSCNHSCPFCISGHIHLKKYMGTKYFDRTILEKNIFDKLIKDLVKTNIKAINWTGGGEPTINPYFSKAINYIHNNSKIEMGMFSNGSLFERFNLFEDIVKCLKWVRISIDAGEKKTYNSLRQTNKNNDFDTVIKNIKKLIKFKKKYNSNIIIGVGFVVTKDNYNEIEKFSKLFSKIDVDYCQFKPEIIQIERSKNNKSGLIQISSDFWIKKVIKSLDKAKAILDKKFECNAYKLEDLIVDVKNYGRNYKECIGSQFQPCIGADGHVYVCTNHRGHKNYSYGNIFEKSFKDIWDDLSTRKKIMDQINNKEKFSKCTHLCKPHESNKILWSIKKNINNKDYFKKLKRNSKFIKGKLQFTNFI